MKRNVNGKSGSNSKVDPNAARLIGKPTPAKKVLVVDSDDFVRNVISKVLQTHLGCEVFSARSGREAITEALTGAYDAAVIELILPHTSGIEAIRAIKEMMPAFPIIAMTSEQVKGREELLKSIGVRRVFYKPVRMSSLIVELKGIVETGGETPVSERTGILNSQGGNGAPNAVEDRSGFLAG